MSSQNSLKEDEQRLRWPAFAVAALLALGILFGGGGAEGSFNNGIIFGASAILLFGLIAAHFSGVRHLPPSTIVPLLIVAGFLLVGGVQLIPVPSSAWHAQPGRETATAVLQLVGSATGPRPLSLDPDATRRAMAAMLLPAALMLAAIGSSRREIQLFLYTVIGCALISAIVGALQLGLRYPRWLTYYEGANLSSASGVFANVNHHATLLLAAILMVGIAVRLNAARASDYRGARGRKFDPTWLLIPVFVVVILATGSRAALLLLILAVPVAVIIGIGRTSVKLLVAALLGVGLVVLVLSELAPAGNQVALNQSLAVSQDKRYAILPDVWFTLKQFWPAGSGFGSFAQVFALNEDLDIAGYAYVNHAHNDLLELLIEAGLPGLIWIVLTVIAVVTRVVLAQLRDRSGRSIRAALVWGGFFLLALVGLHSLADYPLRTPAIGALAGLALGLVFAPERLGRAEPRGKSTSLILFISFGMVALLLGGQVLRMYAAQAAVRSGNGSTALRIDPENGGGLALASEAQLQAHHVGEAQKLAADALRKAPLSVRAVRVLALARDIENRGGMQAWRLASGMGWRDPTTQFWAMEQALLNHEYATSAIRADALLRTSPDPGRERIGAIRAIANVVPFRAALIQRLLLEPRWSSLFFTVPAKASDQELQGVYLTLTDLVRAGNRVTAQEARSAIQTLIERRHYSEAVALDRMVTKRSSENPGDLLDFTDDADHYVFDVTPFDWNIVDRGGTVVSVEQSGSQRVLDLGTDGRQYYQPVRKYIALAPGTYAVGYSTRGEPTSPSVLRIAVYCAGSREPLAVSSGEGLSETGSVHREFRFAVSASCPLVLLAFEAMPGQGPSEAQFADLSLSAV